MVRINETLTGNDLLSLEERIRRLENLTASQPLETVRYPTGLHLRLDESGDFFPAKVTAYNASTQSYAWTEQVILGDGTRTDPVAGQNVRTGSFTDLTAYEINNVQVKVPCQVFMRRRTENTGVSPVFEFESPCGMCVDSGTIPNPAPGPAPAPGPGPGGGGDGGGTGDCGCGNGIGGLCDGKQGWVHTFPMWSNDPNDVYWCGPGEPPAGGPGPPYNMRGVYGSTGCNGVWCDWTYAPSIGDGGGGGTPPPPNPGPLPGPIPAPVPGPMPGPMPGPVPIPGPIGGGGGVPPFPFPGPIGGGGPPYPFPGPNPRPQPRPNPNPSPGPGFSACFFNCMKMCSLGCAQQYGINTPGYIQCVNACRAECTKACGVGAGGVKPPAPVVRGGLPRINFPPVIGDGDGADPVLVGLIQGTATQVVKNIALTHTGTVTMAQLTANQNNYAVGNFEVVEVKTDGTGNKNITGIAMTGVVDGQEVTIRNIHGVDTVTLVTGSASSSASNRIYLNPYGALGNIVLNPGQSTRLVYSNSGLAGGLAWYQLV